VEDNIWKRRCPGFEWSLVFGSWSSWVRGVLNRRSGWAGRDAGDSARGDAVSTVSRKIRFRFGRLRNWKDVWKV
jgi:hypothetical protein